MNLSLSENLRLILPDASAEIHTQVHHPIVQKSSYIRMQLNVQKQPVINRNGFVQIILHGIDTVEAFNMAVMWASNPEPSTFRQLLPSLDAGNPESLLSRYVEYFYSLLELYKVAEKLVMQGLTRQILDLLDIDAFHQPGVTEQFPNNFLRSPRAPSYGMLGNYLYCWLDVAHKQYLHLLTLEQAEPLLDIMERLRNDSQVARTKVKFDHKQNIRNMEKIWSINPLDDLPHRFTLFPSHAMRRKSKVTRGRKIKTEDVEMLDVF